MCNVQVASKRTRSVLVAILLFAFVAPSHAYRIIYAPWAEQNQSDFGSSMECVGDAASNGVLDFVIGARSYDDGGFNTGRAYLYLPTTAGAFPDPVVLTHAESPSLFGKDIAPAGDVNDDGFDDFLITSENIRAVHLFLGDADPASITRVVIPSPDDERSTSAYGVGDVNNDGYDDFLVGALWDNVAWLYFGGDSVDSTPDMTMNGSGDFGFTVAPLGDINSDGFADFSIGAPHFQVDDITPGAVFFYLGGSTPDAVPDFTFLGTQHQEGFGRPMKLGGDLNGDGLRDLIVAAPYYDDLVDASGRLDILYLDATVGAVRGTSIYGINEHEIWHFDSDADIDLDGIPDLVMAPDWYSSEAPLSMFSGATLGTKTSVNTGEADWRDYISATALTSVGDVNGDGYRELLIGNTADYSHGWGGRAALLAGGHRVYPRFRVESTTVGSDSPIELILYASLDTTDPTATATLSALDLSLSYDLSLVTFLGAEPFDSAGTWLHNDAVHGNEIQIAMAAEEAFVIGVSEQPFIRLRFQTGTIAGQTEILLDSLEAHASIDLPLWPQFKPGILTVTAPTPAPPPALMASVNVYPNPFNPRTTIEWVSPTTGPTTLQIFDARGRRVWAHVAPDATAGRNTIQWTAVDDLGYPAAAGTYILDVHGDTWYTRTRLTLVR